MPLTSWPQRSPRNHSPPGRVDVNGLGRLRNRLYGTIVPLIQDVVARDIDELVDQLLGEAAEIWREGAWRRFDNREANCTIQMFRCSREAKRRNPIYGVLNIQIEYVIPTRAMFDATEDATGMARPDVRVSVGEVDRIVECKRLSLTGGRPRSYVYDGMARFVRGVYSSGGGIEYMIGYLQEGDVEDVVAAVNCQVLAHPLMDSSDSLGRSPASPVEVAHRFRSEHKRNRSEPFRINHYILDLRGNH